MGHPLLNRTPGWRRIGLRLALAAGPATFAGCASKAEPPAVAAEAKPDAPPAAAEDAPVYPPPESRASQPKHAPWTINRILLAAPAAGDAAGAEARPTLTLAASEPGAVGGQSLLSREIFRQGLLLAARDELGLATRDASIGDPVDARSGREVGELASDSHFHSHAVATLRVGAGPVPELMIEEDYTPQTTPTNPYGIKPNYVMKYPLLVERVEALSRGRFVHALKRAGCAGSPPPARSEAAVPDAIEEDLARPGLPAQFAAVRGLHAAIRRDGESPRLLGALVRGYAQLGVLTEFHWNSAHEAYKARALLYAQRLAARAPASPWSLRHRAFARALAGLPGAALADLKEADRLAATPAPGPPPAAALAAKPGWTDLIEAYCRHDRAALAQPAGARLAALAALLGFLEVEYSNATALVIETARAALETYPDCSRINDALCRVGGVGTQHWATELGPAALTQALPLQLPEIPGFPAAARGPLAGGDEPAMTRALVAAGAAGVDAGEPTWATLAGMIRETRFTQSWRRLYFMRTMWGVPVGEELDAVRPLVADHPYRAFIESFGLDPARQPREMAALLKDVVPTDLDRSWNPIWMTIQRVDRLRANALSSRTGPHDDHTARDQVIRLAARGPGYPAGDAADLLEISPGSPTALVALIRDGWEFVEKEARGWEDAYRRHPEILGELAKKYAALKRPDDAERCLRAYLRLSGDRWAVEMLADAQLARGDETAWKATLDEALRRPDYGLDHMMIQARLARHLMHAKRWAEALPYAEASAESGAATGMLVVVACYEGMHEWDKADAVLRGMVERYPETAWPHWLLWCARTGHGDLESARRVADRAAEALGMPQGPDEMAVVGHYYAWAGRPAQAIPPLSAHFLRMQDPLVGTCVAVLADESKDFAHRDAVIEQLLRLTTPPKPGERAAVRDPKAREALHRFYEVLRTWLADGAGKPPDLKAIDEALAALAPGYRGGLECLVARLLADHDRAADSLAYFKRSAATPGTNPWLRAMAIRAAREGGVELTEADVAAP